MNFSKDFTFGLLGNTKNLFWPLFWQTLICPDSGLCFLVKIQFHLNSTELAQQTDQFTSHHWSYFLQVTSLW